MRDNVRYLPPSLDPTSLTGDVIGSKLVAVDKVLSPLSPARRTNLVESRDSSPPNGNLATSSIRFGPKSRTEAVERFGFLCGEKCEASEEILAGMSVWFNYRNLLGILLEFRPRCLEREIVPEPKIGLRKCFAAFATFRRSVRMQTLPISVSSKVCSAKNRRLLALF